MSSFLKLNLNNEKVIKMTHHLLSSPFTEFSITCLWLPLSHFVSLYCG